MAPTAPASAAIPSPRAATHAPTSAPPTAAAGAPASTSTAAPTPASTPTHLPLRSIAAASAYPLLPLALASPPVAAHVYPPPPPPFAAAGRPSAAPAASLVHPFVTGTAYSPTPPFPYSTALFGAPAAPAHAPAPPPPPAQAAYVYVTQPGTSQAFAIPLAALGGTGATGVGGAGGGSGGAAGPVLLMLPPGTTALHTAGPPVAAPAGAAFVLGGAPAAAPFGAPTGGFANPFAQAGPFAPPFVARPAVSLMQALPQPAAPAPFAPPPPPPPPPAAPPPPPSPARPSRQLEVTVPPPPPPPSFMDLSSASASFSDALPVGSPPPSARLYEALDTPASPGYGSIAMVPGTTSPTLLQDSGPSVGGGGGVGVGAEGSLSSFATHGSTSSHGESSGGRGAPDDPGLAYRNPLSVARLPVWGSADSARGVGVGGGGGGEGGAATLELESGGASPAAVSPVDTGASLLGLVDVDTYGFLDTPLS